MGLSAAGLDGGLDRTGLVVPVQSTRSFEASGEAVDIALSVASLDDHHRRRGGHPVEVVVDLTGDVDRGDRDGGGHEAPERQTLQPRPLGLAVAVVRHLHHAEREEREERADRDPLDDVVLHELEPEGVGARVGEDARAQEDVTDVRPAVVLRLAEEPEAPVAQQQSADSEPTSPVHEGGEVLLREVLVEVEVGDEVDRDVGRQELDDTEHDGQEREDTEQRPVLLGRAGLVLERGADGESDEDRGDPRQQDVEHGPVLGHDAHLAFPVGARNALVVVTWCGRKNILVHGHMASLSTPVPGQVK